MRKPYLKKYKDIDGFKVFIVDGQFIRRKLNGQFTDFGQHYRFPHMIPLKELWLDKQYSNTKEYDIFITHMLKEWDLMSNGKDYGSANVHADIEEKNARELSQARACKLKEIGVLPNGVSVWLVNGKKIRDDSFIDFTEGGHDLVYDWIPRCEIWIDNAISAKERPYVLLHESEERDLMDKGYNYKKAHNSASIEEKKMRNMYKELHLINRDGVLYVSNKSDKILPTFISDNIGKRIKLRYFNKPKMFKSILATKKLT